MLFEADNPSTNKNCWSILSKFPVQRRFIDDSLFSSGNHLCQSVLGKKCVVIYDNEDFLHQKYEVSKFLEY